MNIHPIDPSGRNLGGLDFFILWAGVAISLAEIWAGGFLAPMGFQAGLWAILLGHVIGNTFMALGGAPGAEHGITAMVSVRAAFGIRGSNLAAVLNIIQLIGWASIMLIIGGQAGAALGRPMGGIAARNEFWIILIGLGTLLWALFTGKPLWKRLQSAAVVGLAAVILLMTWVSVRTFGTGLTAAVPKPMPFMTGLDLVIAMPISWMPLVSDYSRFAKSPKSAFWNTWGGYFIVSSWMYVLGLMATLVTGESDPGMLILRTMGALGLAVPGLVMVVFSTITSDFPDVYSATCSVLNISQRVGARAVMWIAGLLSIGVALIFPIDQYENFLLLIGAMFVPLFGVVITDYFLIRRRRLDVADLYREGGRYWYHRGFNFRALLCWACGFLLFEAILWMDYPLGGSLPAITAAGLLYYGLTPKTEREEPAPPHPEKTP